MNRSTAYLDRFGGIGRLYGTAEQDAISQLRLTVVGLGGVGSWVVEALARTGIGQLTLIDMDDICVTNTNRQIQAAVDQLGKTKVEALAERVRLINPEMSIKPLFDFLTENNLATLLADTDGVVDAIDSVTAKAALIAHCKRTKIPVVTTGAAGGQIDPTQVTMGDLNKTYNDPLAKKVRSLLRRRYGYSRNPARTYGVPCVFSVEQLRYPKPDGSVCGMKQIVDGESTRLDCASGFGASTMVTGTFGFVAAAQIVQRCLRKKGF